MDGKMIFGGILAVVLVGALVYALWPHPWVFADDQSPVMYFYQDSCIHCKAMKPILDELGQQGYRVKLMNAEKNPQYWTQYNVTGTPMWVAQNGDRLEGEQSKADLQAWFDAHGAKIA